MKGSALTQTVDHDLKIDADSILERTSSLSEEIMANEIQTMLEDQIKQYFRALQKALLHKETAASGGQKFPLGFLPVLRPSTCAADAGLGVFMQGRCEAGSVVLFHPGLVYAERDVRHMPGFPTLQDENFMLVVRRDGAIIDPLHPPPLVPSLHFHPAPPSPPAARDASSPGLLGGKAAPGPPAPPSSATAAADARAAASEAAAAWSARNPLALGHMVNHGSGGERASPNVCSVDFDFPPHLPQDLWPLLPYVLFVGPRTPGTLGGLERMIEWQLVAAGQAAMSARGVIPAKVLVATRNLEDGEELLSDYRLDPARKSAWPPWYQPFDEDAARRRWS